jgi:hypothetical protein
MAEPVEPQSGMDRKAALAEVRGTYLDGLARLARQSGVYSTSAIEALCRGSGQFFDDMTSGDGRAGFEAATGLTASKIGLVDDQQLEVTIRLSELGRRLQEECSAALYKLYQRFVTLLERPDLSGDDNPVAPEGVCHGLSEMFADLGERHEESLERLNEIATRLVQELPVLYAELNEVMARHRVHAARTQSRNDREVAGTREARNRTDPMAALQKSMLAHRQPENPYSSSSSPGGSTDAAAAAYGAAMFDQLLGRLNQWQQQGQSDLFGGAGGAGGIGVGIENALQALKTGDLAPLMRAQEAATLDVLAALFDALFDDPKLADAIKAAIARLQIPLLKAAVLDPGFFSDREHPARVLLDTMAAAAAGLGPDVDGEHPVCAELRRIATAVQVEFERDPEVFANHTAELETFMARRNHDLQAQAQGYIALAEVQDGRDLAAQMAQRLVGNIVVAAAPAVIGDFLRREWRQVLEAAWLAEGEDGAVWRDAKSVVPDLLASVQSQPDPEERKRVAMRIPALLQKIRTGLDRIGVSAEARAPFLDACLALQTAVLRGKALPAEAAAAASSPAAGDATVSVLDRDGLTLRMVRFAQPGSHAADDFSGDLAVGDWVEFEMPDTTGSRRGRLCWISPALGNPLFANPDWDCAISLDRGYLERQLSSGRATVSGRQSFFDAAAEKALRRKP